MQIGEVEIDPAARTAWRGSERLALNEAEWRLMELLVRGEGEPLSPQYLLQEIWGPAFQQDEAYLATWIWRLRQKLEPDPRHPSFLKTVPQRGYALATGG